MNESARKRKRYKYNPVRGRPWGSETQLKLSDLMLDAQSQLRDTIVLMLAAYQQLSEGQRLIFKTQDGRNLTDKSMTT